MTQPSSEQTNGYTWFQRFWPIFVMLLGFAITWGAFQTRMETVERQVDRNETHLVTVDTTFTEIKVTLMRIETDIGYIRKELDRHAE